MPVPLGWLPNALRRVQGECSGSDEPRWFELSNFLPLSAGREGRCHTRPQGDDRLPAYVEGDK